ncbi:MAG TPA: hypothetical protein VMT52_12460 [Planctomycetota bacterium]|nr:hypothetical protein [Planctomycetota bacterium]
MTSAVQMGGILLDGWGLLALTAEGSGGQLSTFYRFATALSSGIAVSLPLIPAAGIGRRFFVLLSFISIVFLSLALAASGLAMSYFHLAAGGLLIAYNVLLPRERGVDVSARREALQGGGGAFSRAAVSAVLGLAIACGLAGIVTDSLDGSRAAPGERPWLCAASLASTCLLGAATTAMVLGHWYLVSRKLSFTPLARLTLFLGSALLARAVVAGGAAWAQAERWDGLISRSGMTGFLAGSGLFVLVRALFGFVAPAAFVALTWRCIAIRSNQSATGILYVTLAFVLIGEIIAWHFLVSDGLIL